MSSPEALTELEYFLLGQLGRKARSGYELGQIVTSMPMTGFSSSPGSIYPALGRLEERGLARARAVGQGRRPRAEYRLTRAGRRVVRRWAELPITAEDLLRRPDLLLLRYSFLDFESADDRPRAFLQRYVEAARTGRGTLSAYASAAAVDAAPHARAALELARDILGVHEAWAQRERERIEAGASADDRATTAVVRHEAIS